MNICYSSSRVRVFRVLYSSAPSDSELLRNSSFRADRDAARLPLAGDIHKTGLPLGIPVLFIYVLACYKQKEKTTRLHASMHGGSLFLFAPAR